MSEAKLGETDRKLSKSFCGQGNSVNSNYFPNNIHHKIGNINYFMAS